MLWITIAGYCASVNATGITTDLLDNIIVSGNYIPNTFCISPSPQVIFPNSDGTLTVPPITTANGTTDSFIIKYTGHFQSLFLPPPPLPLKYKTIVMNESTDTDTLITISQHDLIDLTGRHISHLIMRKRGELITLLWDGIQWTVVSDQGVRKIYA